MILEYKLHMTPGGMKAPDWVDDGGYFPNGNRFIGWTRDNPEFYIPSTVVVLTASELETKILAQHAENAFQKEDEETGEMSDMTNAEVSAMVDSWVKSKS